MTVRPSPLRAQLRSLEPARARLQSDVIAALNQRELDGLRIVARLASLRDRNAAAAWIRFETSRGPIAIAPLLVDGALAALTRAPGQPDGVAAAATLGRIEALVSAAETVFGVELHPAGLLPSLAGEPLLIRLDANDRGGTIRHRLLLALPPELDVEPLPLPPSLPSPVAGLRLRWRARLPAPPLRPHHFETLSTGDLLVLGTRPLVARLSLPGHSGSPTARVDLARGVLIVGDVAQPGGDGVNDMNASVRAEGEAGADWSEVRLPSTIEFEGASLTAAELATLGAGSVLPLPAQGGTLAVKVVVGETVIADGELVALGEGFGVLLTGMRAKEG